MRRTVSARAGTVAAVADDVSLAEIARRLDRIESRLDARTLTVDVYAAEKIAMGVRFDAAERRIGEVEDAIRSATRLVIGAFIGLLAEGLLVVFAVIGK